MTEEEIKAIEETKNIIEEVTDNTKEEIPTYIFDRDIKCLPILVNLIEKQNKMIDLMAEDIKSGDEYLSSEFNNSGYADYTIEQIKEEYIRRVEENAKN